ncbi:MAG: hypothetical protein KDN05_12695 [Verrucomicrobiae bacterium]|nr:hypothetical protein [Verrucomicrobiae bacterium]
MKPIAILLALVATTGAQTLIGWNNLGMHCMDDDYSVFSILPPFNTFDAHLIDAQGHLVTDPAGIVVTYEGVADPDGSINTTSVGKTTFWDYTTDYFGVALPPDTGLTGKTMPGPSNTPQFMDFDGVMNWFEGAGIPITPVDDAGRRNPYPMVRLTAKTTGGTVLATTDIVLPVSSEMDCRKCHGSGSGPAAEPVGGWVNDPHPSRDYRLNILRLHDEKHLGTEPYTSALADKGYPAAGLEASVIDQQHPVLCAACHASEALGAPSYPGVKPLTQSMHAFHANVVAPDTGMVLDHVANRSSCYQCHPGSDTRCLRGAMGAAVAADGSASMQCQSCHGTMSDVGAPAGSTNRIADRATRTANVSPRSSARQVSCGRRRAPSPARRTRRPRGSRSIGFPPATAACNAARATAPLTRSIRPSTATTTCRTSPIKDMEAQCPTAPPATARCRTP